MATRKPIPAIEEHIETEEHPDTGDPDQPQDMTVVGQPAETLEADVEPDMDDNENNDENKEQSSDPKRQPIVVGAGRGLPNILTEEEEENLRQKALELTEARERKDRAATLQQPAGTGPTRQEQYSRELRRRNREREKEEQEEQAEEEEEATRKLAEEEKQQQEERERQRRKKEDMKLRKRWLREHQLEKESEKTLAAGKRKTITATMSTEPETAPTSKEQSKV